jgi:hypothetical protein
MDWLPTLFVFLAGLALRLAVPIGVTALVVILLRRLDLRWQAEAALQHTAAPAQPCWKLKDCPEQKHANCPAASQNVPCWQVFRQKNGYLQEACLGCEVFRRAPTPAHA